jgi:hypothetical protein
VRCGPTSATILGAVVLCAGGLHGGGHMALFELLRRCFPASSLVVFCAFRWLLVSVVCDHVFVP